MLYDPAPTPAGRAARKGIFTGMAAWLLCIVGIAFVIVADANPDPRIASFLRGTGQIIVGVGVIAFLLGVFYIASSCTLLMNGGPDPGLRWLYIAIALVGTPIVVLAIYGMVLAVMSKVGGR